MSSRSCVNQHGSVRNDTSYVELRPLPPLYRIVVSHSPNTT